MKKRRSLFVIVLCVAMLFSTMSVYAAGVEEKSDENAESRTVINATVSFTRYSALKGKLILSSESGGTHLDYIKAKITVEKKYSGGWSAIGTPYDIYGDAEFGSLDVVEYIDVSSTGVYRIKVVFEDKKGAITSTLSPLYSQAASL